MERRRAINACRPCIDTRIVARRDGDHFELEAELVGDEAALEPAEVACIRSTLEGMPGPRADELPEVFVTVRHDPEMCTVSR